MRILFLLMIFTMLMKVNHIISQPHATHMLFMFFDTTETISFIEDGLDALSYDLQQALNQKVPIITTPSLLKNVLIANNLYHDFTTLSEAKLHQLYDSVLYFNNNSVATYKKHFSFLDTALQIYIQDFMSEKKPLHKIYRLAFLSKKWNENNDFFIKHGIDKNLLKKLWRYKAYNLYNTFKPEEWLCFKLNETLFLLLPRTLHPQLSSYTSSDSNTLTSLEEELGIFIKDYPVVSLKDFLNTKSHKYPSNITFKSEDFFISKLYYQRRHLQPPTWAFYLTAHGSQPQPIETLLNKIVSEIDNENFPRLRQEIQNTSLITTAIKNITDNYMAYRISLNNYLESEQKAHDIITFINKLKEVIDTCQISITNLNNVLTLKTKPIFNNNYKIGTITKNNLNAQTPLIQKYLEHANKYFVDINDLLKNTDALLGSLSFETYNYYKKLKDENIKNVMTSGGFSLLEIHNFLEYASTHLSTSLILIDTCFLGGQAFTLLQTPIISSLEKYPFVFMVKGITEAVTISQPYFFQPPLFKEEQIDNNGHLHISPPNTFYKLFTAITDPHTYTQLQDIASLFGNYDENDISSNNIIQYKEPNKPWTNLAFTQQFARIDTTLAYSRTQPLNIFSYYGTKNHPLKKIIITTPYIPFTLIFDLKKQSFIPDILTNNATDNIITLKKVALTQSKNNVYEQDFFKSFFSIKKQTHTTVWNIETVQMPTRLITNCFIFLNILGKNGIIFTENATTYYCFWDKQMVPPQQLIFSTQAPESHAQIMQKIQTLYTDNSYLTFPTAKISDAIENKYQIMKYCDLSHDLGSIFYMLT